LKYLAAFSLVMIPLLTYLFATIESPFYYTFSKIGNVLGYRLNFILRGVFVGLMIVFFLLRLYVLHAFSDKNARGLLFLSLIFLLLTVAIPAVEHLPMLKRFHALVAVSFALCLSISLYLFTVYLQQYSRKVYIWSLVILFVMVGGSLLMLLLFGMTGIFELFFFGALSVFFVFIHLVT
jgi:putative effector of murein hydrolase LrgA (UPF0299 family)